MLISNYFPSRSSTSIQVDYHPPSSGNRPLSKWFMNGYSNGLSLAIQIVYQPQSKWIINYFPSELSTSIQVDYQPPSSG